MSNASEPKRCPKCGGPIPAEAPQGLCPRCLLAEASIPTEAGTSSKSPPPSLDQLTAAFPQLEILEFIGQGGMGFVFKARQPKLDRFVALKILPQSLAADPAFAERFTREGRLLARLNHPNIVTVHDFGQASGFFYLLMEFVDGVNLRQAMKAGRFTSAQALAVVPRICEALEYAHNEGILHRDIKPENILLDTRGRVKIADFGIAKLIDESRAEALLTATGAKLGTPHYMAPEQIEKPSEVDHRADIYSLGVVFYEMLTGELPLGRFAPPSEKSSTDPRLDDVVLRTLAKEPSRRTQSAGEVKTQIETITESRQGTPPPNISPPPSAQALAWAKWIGIALLCLSIPSAIPGLFMLYLAVRDGSWHPARAELINSLIFWTVPIFLFATGFILVTLSYLKNTPPSHRRGYIWLIPFAFAILVLMVAGTFKIANRRQAITPRNDEAANASQPEATSTPTFDPNRTKTITFTGATNQLIDATNNIRVISVHTPSTLFPDETLTASAKHPDGQSTPINPYLFITAGPKGFSTSTYFSWFLPTSFDEGDAESALTQLRQNIVERPLTLINAKPILLFSISNRFGAPYEAHVEFKHSPPSAPAHINGTNEPVQARVHIRSYTDFFPSLTYTVKLPVGYRLQASANEGQASTFIADMNGKMEYRSSWTHLSHSVPLSGARNRVSGELDQRSALKKQFEALYEQGPFQVTLGEAKTVFALTSDNGEVFEGKLELVGPDIKTNADTPVTPPRMATPPSSSIIPRPEIPQRTLRLPPSAINSASKTNQ
jgi:tRNA A-37 threonylcarbamoyl transferase component Bud32